MQFIHLQVHTEYSLIDGIVRIESLIEAAAKFGMPSVALTDQSNLFAAIKFYQAAIAAGIKPIIGCDVCLENKEHPESPYRAILLCQNQQGYKNLIHLVSQSYLTGQQNERPLIRYAWLEKFNEGLLILSGGVYGDVGQNLLAHKKQLANEYLKFWQTHFPERYYLTVQRCGKLDEEKYIQLILPLAVEYQIPVVATNDVRFLEKEDFEAHEARVAIRQGYTISDPKRPKQYTTQQYFRSADEMKQLFSDIPEAIENTIEIAKRCSLEFQLGVVHMPDFPLPQEVTIEQYLEKKSFEGLERRLQIIFRENISDLAELSLPYQERLKLELSVISKMGFAGYFLIVADFIQWSKQQGIPVGPGRGSGAGSLVAYALGITDLDPLQYDLLFERFLNPERVSMPDFDIDFCMEGRDRVIDYVMERYGRDRVSQIITYGSMAAKAVVRDVGRVLGHPYGFVDKIAKMIPFELGITLDKALEQSEFQDLYQNDEEVRELIDLARVLEGLARNVGKHAGGVIISPAALTEFVPLYCESTGENLVTQFDKDDAEAIGLIKFDFLGLRTLTIIDWALKIINADRKEKGEEPLDISLIDMTDPATYNLLKACQTTAVFQLESRGMKDLVRRLKPDCFEDIIALVALFRPGPLQSGMVDDFINRKHGLAKVEYLHDSLQSVLKPTYGIILYQEQVMQIAQIMGGYTLGEADLLRRAMGKKKPEEMARQRNMFTEGAVQRGVDRRTATHIFDLMEKFAGYGFNKSHSAAYALLAYQTAWLKTHYSAAFMAAVLSSDMDNTDKVVNFIDDCKSMHLKVRPPHVNHSNFKFSVLDEKTIIYGLGAIKGVGENAVESIIAARNEGELFENLFDFCLRVDLRKVNRRTMEALIKSGSLDHLGAGRSSMMASLERALAFAEQRSKAEEQGQVDLFSFELQNKTDYEFVNVPEWNIHQRLLGEKETLGFYLSGHPLERYSSELSYIVKQSISELTAQRDKTSMISGLVIQVRKLQTKRGDPMAILTIDDRSGRIDVTVFSELYEASKNLLEKDQILIVQGETGVDNFTGGLRFSARRLWSIEQARISFAKAVKLTLEKSMITSEFLDKLQAVFLPFKSGKCPVVVEYRRDEAVAQLNLSQQWLVNPVEPLLDRLHELLGEEQVSVIY